MPFGPYSSTFSFTVLTLADPSCQPTPTRDSLQTALRELVEACCLPANWVVIYADQNAPRPSNTAAAPPGYVTIRMDAWRKRGLRDPNGPILQLDTDVFAERLVGDREFVAAFAAFGPGANQALQTLETCLDHQGTLDTLRAADLAVVEVLAVQNLSGLYDSQFQERALLEVRFRTHSEVEDRNVSYIEEVQGEATHATPDGSEVTVPYSVDSTP